MPVFAASISSIPPEFVCKLCQSPWEPTSAVACPKCEEIYCCGCVEDNATKARQCACGEEFAAEKFQPAHRSVRNLADAKVLVKCKNYLRGCRWAGPRSELGAHHGTCAEAVKAVAVPVGPVPDELLCGICRELLANPASLPCCEKLLCNTCASESLALRPCCPMCNAPLAAADLRKAPKQIETQLDEVAVRCPHRDVGCRFEGPLRNFHGHIAACNFELGAGPTVARPDFKVMNDVPQLLWTKASEQAPVELTTMLHIQAPTLLDLRDRKMPLRMCAVIDVSGSMKGEKLELTKESLRFMIGELSERDSFSLVVFDSTIQRIMSMTAMSHEAKARSIALVDTLVDRNCTNLCGGLLEGLSCVADAQNASLAEECADALLLFTDGAVNEGICDPSAIVNELKRFCGAMKKAPAVYTFGFGADPNTTLLQRIAEATQGSYYYVRDSSVLRDCFADCLGGLISIVMSEISVTFTLAHGATLKCLMTKYPTTRNDDGSTTVLIKDMYSAEVRDIPMAIAVVAASFTGNADVESCDIEPVSWDVSYTSALDQQKHRQSLKTRVLLASSPFVGNPDLYVDEQRNRFNMALALEEAKRHAEARNFESARQTMAMAVEKAQCTPSAAAPQLQRMMMECEVLQVDLVPHRYSKGGAQTMTSCFDRYSHQRCNEASDDAMYQNEWKRCMKKK
jgi:Mg-chelatase subunit ChlD